MSVPIISVAQMREWERATWDAGIKEEDVIRQVGLRLRDWLLRSPAVSSGNLLIIAGKGNNGEDARQCAAAFEREGLQGARIVNVRDPVADLPALDTALMEFGDGTLLDALFGIGINRPLGEDWIEVVNRINETGAEIYSVDCPSGLDADTGEVMGAAVRADRTLTLGAPKRGLLTSAAAEYVGKLELEPDIGLSTFSLTGGMQWVVPADFQGMPPKRRAASHKGSFGHLAVLAGSVGYHGAAVLAAEGALAAAPGLVTVLTQAGCYVPVACQLKSAMVHPWADEIVLPEKCSAVLVGPGLAAGDLPVSVRDFTRDLWRESPLGVIADASALDWLPEGAAQEGALRVITPHPGEAARMLGTTTAAVQAERVASLRELSAKFGGCWVVLKGHQTLVGRCSGEISVNSTGNPWLARGGSGDVLAGFVGGLLAQPELAGDAGEAIRYAVWKHGLVADLAEPGEANGWPTVSIDGMAAQLGVSHEWQWWPERELDEASPGPEPHD